MLSKNAAKNSRNKIIKKKFCWQKEINYIFYPEKKHKLDKINENVRGNTLFQPIFFFILFFPGLFYLA